MPSHESSDRYALGMEIYGILSGRITFCSYPDLLVVEVVLHYLEEASRIWIATKIFPLTAGTPARNSDPRLSIGSADNEIPLSTLFLTRLQLSFERMQITRPLGQIASISSSRTLNDLQGT